MQAYEHVRCLFCESGREGWVCQLIERLGLGHAISPRKVKRLFRRHDWVNEASLLLPGYVFVYFNGEIPLQTFLEMRHVLRVLRYHREDETGYLVGDDLELALTLLKNDGLVGVLSAVREGSWIEITDGYLKQFHGTVVKMDRRKQQVKVRLDVAGSINEIWLSYEVVEAKDRDDARLAD